MKKLLCMACSRLRCGSCSNVVTRRVPEISNNGDEDFVVDESGKERGMRRGLVEPASRPANGLSLEDLKMMRMHLGNSQTTPENLIAEFL